MSKVTSGVFPVNVTQIEVDTGSGEPNWVPIAELEEASVSIDNTIQTWQSFANGGWGSALVTAKSAKLTLKGKRSIGDPGNDLIAGKLLAMGADAYVGVRITHADGSSLTWAQMACGVSDSGQSGKAEDVGALEAELTAHGKPEFKAAS